MQKPHEMVMKMKEKVIEVKEVKVMKVEINNFYNRWHHFYCLVYLK